MYYPSIEYMKNDFFEIKNFNSDFNQYYHLASPFNAVIETYRSDLEKPYFKMAGFAPDQCHHYMIDNPAFLEKMMSRPLHQHDFFEIMFVLQGEAVIKIEDTKRVYPAGTGCIVNCNLRHVEMLSHDFRIFFLNLSKDYILSIFQADDIFKENCAHSQDELQAFHFLNQNVTNANNNQKEYMDFYPTYNNNTSYHKLYTLAENIISTILSPQIGSSFFINGYICQFLKTISDDTLYHLSNIQIAYGNDFFIFSQLTHLLENSNGRLSRSELSSALNYSGDYLNRISKKYTGMSLFEYGTTFTIRKAEYYLLKTDMSVSEIVSALAFTNKSHFYKLFYDKHKMSPKEYRNKYRRT